VKIQTIFIISFVLMELITTGCSEKSNEFFDPSYWSGPYKGITFTDACGLTQKDDPDDWCVYYGETDDPYQVAPIGGSYVFMPAYPNPVKRDNGYLTFRFFTDKESKIKITIDDDMQQTVKIFVDSTFSRGLYELPWDLKNDLGKKVPGGIYRCYMFAQDFSCYGDIWIK
jgi:hypothetical protein